MKTISVMVASAADATTIALGRGWRRQRTIAMAASTAFTARYGSDGRTTSATCRIVKSSFMRSACPAAWVAAEHAHERAALREIAQRARERRVAAMPLE